jgi:thioredoxin 1
VREFNDNNFDSEVLNSKEPVLVDFWAEWCMPCRNLAPVIESVATEMAGKVKVGKVDIDSATQLSVKFGISAIPTVILFKNGQAVKRYVGFQKKETLVAAINEASAG